MGFLNRVFREGETPPRWESGGSPSEDAQALERYRYLLRTAPPDAVEQAHAEAFAQLTPEQRTQVLRELSDELPPDERVVGPGRDDPKALARMATRAELRQPGTLERAFGGRGTGGTIGGSLLSSVAGAFIGSAIAQQLFGGMSGDASAEAGPGEVDSLDQVEPSSVDDDTDHEGDLMDLGD